MPLIQCVDCNSQISSTALACPKCGRPNDALPAQLSPNVQRMDTTGSALLAAPVVGIGLILFWVAQMSLIQRPSSSLGLVTVMVVLGTALLAAGEVARANRNGVDHPMKSSGPIAWFIFLCLFWIVSYPYYMHYRRHLGHKGYLVMGVLLALAMTGISASIGMAINDQEVAVQNQLREIQDNLEKSRQDFDQKMKDLGVR